MATHAAGFSAPPAALVEAGAVHLGRWTGPLARTSLLDAPYYGLPRALRRWRLKEWQAVQLATPTLFVNLALVDAKLMTLLQVKAYDRARGVKHLHERKLWPRAFRPTEQLLDSRVAYGDRTSALAFTNRLAHGRVEIDLACAARGGGPAMHGHVDLFTDDGASQVVNLPFAHGSIYSHKGLFPARGELTIAGVRHDLTGAVAMLDDHKAYYPYVMNYDWVTSLWRGDDGVMRGFNLTRNQVVEPTRWNENGAWIGDRVATLPAVTFTREDERGRHERWLVRDREGRVDLVFEPTVPGDVALDVGVIESRYRGPFGICRGRLEPDGLPAMTVDDRFGMGEDFWLRC